jgi:hypothetical protein
MNRVRWGLLMLVAAIVLQITWYTVLMISYIRIPGKLAGADFLTYYSVGRVANQYGFGNVYNLNFEAAAQAETAGIAVGTQFVLPPNHPPFLFPFLSLLARLPYRSAYFGYAALLCALLITGLITLGRVLSENGWSRYQTWVLAGGVLLFEPFFMSILKGQDSAVLLLGGLLWLCGLTRKDDRLAGLGLSLMLIRPQIALTLAVPFLFKQRKVFYWFILGATVLGLFSFVLIGWSGVMDYLHILTLSAGGVGYGMAESAMFNLTGLLLRLAPSIRIYTLHTIGWIGFAVAVMGLCIAWSRLKTIRYSSMALAVCLSLVMAPHLHYHDLALLAVPLVGLGVAGVSSGRFGIWMAAAIPMAVSVIMLFSEFWDPARFTFPYLLMAILPVVTWWYENSSTNGPLTFLKRGPIERHNSSQ